MSQQQKEFAVKDVQDKLNILRDQPEVDDTELFDLETEAVQLELFGNIKANDAATMSSALISLEALVKNEKTIWQQIQIQPRNLLLRDLGDLC